MAYSRENGNPSYSGSGIQGTIWVLNHGGRLNTPNATYGQILIQSSNLMDGLLADAFACAVVRSNGRSLDLLDYLQKYNSDNG